MGMQSTYYWVERQACAIGLRQALRGNRSGERSALG